MIGGCSMIPCVRKTLQRIFGKERVKLHRPLDAVALGTAAFASGMKVFDHIQHDYAIRYLDTETGAYEYRVIVRQGTPYPTAQPVARLTVSATYDKQEQFGIAIFEIGAGESGDGIELVFDPSGAPRVVRIPTDERYRRKHFWMNEGKPTFLTAHPASHRGEKRFEITFSVDANKRLLLTARDRKTHAIEMEDFSVAQLS